MDGLPHSRVASMEPFGGLSMLLKVAPPARISKGTVARTVRTALGAVEGVGPAGLLPPPPPQAERPEIKAPQDRTAVASVRRFIGKSPRPSRYDPLKPVILSACRPADKPDRPRRGWPEMSL